MKGRLSHFSSHRWPRWVSLTIGFGVVVLIWYLLYRLTLPAKPFIYVAF